MTYRDSVTDLSSRCVRRREPHSPRCDWTERVWIAHVKALRYLSRTLDLADWPRSGPARAKSINER